MGVAFYVRPINKGIPMTIQNAEISKSRGDQIQGMALMI
jgi:hypothetical protein